MNEIQRQQYLEAMGVDTYMPRWILPSAATPLACSPVLPRAEQEGSPLASAAQLSSQPSSQSSPSSPGGGASELQAQPLTQPLVQTQAQAIAPEGSAAAAEAIDSGAQAAPKSAPLDVLATIESPAESAKKSAPASAKSILEGLDTAKRPDPRFALSLWRVNDDVMVIDSRHSELALPTEPLLRNILSALGFAPQPLPKAEVLRWPMFENSYEPQGQEIARETLQAMLEGMLEARSGKYLLLMGAEACHYLLSAEQLGEGFDPQVSLDKHLGQSFVLEALSATAIVVPSLSDLLQQPLLKRGAWRAIQPLRQR
ncbi:MAG: hypothetical protein ACRBBW_12700 [Cellvibrionaceae bacterium]